MKKGFVVLMVRYVLIILLTLLLTPAAGVADDFPCEGYRDERVRSVVDLVHRGVAAIESEGEAVFAAMNRSEPPWGDGGLYVFVHDMDGRLLVNPSYPLVVGRQMIDFKDVSGKSVVRNMIDLVRSSPGNSGWNHYLWPRQGEVEPSWKSSFVHLAQGPDGREYVIGSGVHDAMMEECFAVHMVEAAARLVRREGEKAFERIGRKSGPFIWGEFYVFVVGIDGVQHVNPAHQQYDGKTLSAMPDDARKQIFRKMRAKAGDGKPFWITYRWPRPGYVAPTAKKTYVKPVSHAGKTYLVGCGVYLD